MGLFGKKKQKTIVRYKDMGSPLVRYKKSFFHALDGIAYAIREEHNMIIILLAALTVGVLGFICKITPIEWLFCILIIGLVAGTEMINTAIEATIDLTMPQIHPLAKIAKDTASSATLIFSITAFLGGCVIFIPKIILMM